VTTSLVSALEKEKALANPKSAIFKFWSCPIRIF
jgi:hypothetical protein